MAKNFCPNCGKPLKPNAKFCGHCGEKIITETNTPLDAEISTEEKTTKFNTEINVDNIAQQTLSITDKIKVLPNRIKIVALILVIAIIGYAGYYHFSPEKQATRAAENYIDTVLTLLATDAKDISYDDVDKFSKLFIPEKQDRFRNEMYPFFLNQNAHFKKKPTFEVMSTSFNSDGEAIVYIQIHSDEKIRDFSKPSKVYLKKIDGTWYVDKVN